MENENESIISPIIVAACITGAIAALNYYMNNKKEEDVISNTTNTEKMV